MIKRIFPILSVCILCSLTTFAKQIIRVNVVDAPGGKIERVDLGGGYYQLTATPKEGYSFLSWSDDTKTTQRTFYKSSAPSDTLHAVFIHDNTRCIGGTIMVEIASVTPLTYHLTATPTSCYSFWKWNNGSTNPTIIYTSADCQVEAFYRKPKLSIHNVQCIGGEIQVFEDTCSYHLTALPKSGYVFIGWSDNVYSKERDVAFGEDSLAAQFIPYTQLATISDWGTNHVVFHSSIDLTGYEMRTSIDSSSSFVVAPLTKLDEGIYVAQVPVLNRAAQQELNLRFYNTCGGLASLQRQYIPIVISSPTLSSTIPLAQDIYIQKGGKMMINSTFVADTVVVYGGGKLSIPYGQSMTASSVILRSGGRTMGGTYDYSYPQLFVDGSLTSSSISYDYLLNNAVWYPLSIPQSVLLSDIHYLSGYSAQNKFLVEYYDGQERTKHISGWRDVPTKVLAQGVGYNLFAMPETIAVEGSNKVRAYSRLTIPLTMDLSNGEIKAPSVDVQAYGAGQSSVDFVDMGWNFIGNPYMADYLGDLMLNGNPINYVTIPADDGQSYTQEVTVVAQLPAFRNFFIQTEESGQLLFDRSYRLTAPKRTREHDMDDILVGVTLSSLNYRDQVGIRIGNRYTQDYDINADLLKFDNAQFNVYALGANHRLAFVAINELEKQPIPVGYSAPKGQYTFALNPKYDSTSLLHLYLYDSLTNICTDLLGDTYTFETSSGRFDQRFTISCILQPQIVTDIFDIEARLAPAKRIVNDRLQIYWNEQIFDAQGIRIK